MPENEDTCYAAWVDSNTQWVDWSYAEWGECYAGILNQVWTDDTYVYAAIDFGLDIIDIVSEIKVAYIEYSGGFSTVWANDSKVFFGTTNSGIKYIEKTCISGSLIAPYDLVGCLMDYETPYGITSNVVRYIHGNGDKFACCTNSGVGVFKLEPNGYRSYTTVSGAKKCFMTATGKFYYTVEEPEWSIKRVDVPLVDWVSTDKSYTVGSGILAAGLRINDIFVTEGTSSNGMDNTLFIATSSGVYVIDEGTNQYAWYYTAGG